MSSGTKSTLTGVGVALGVLVLGALLMVAVAPYYFTQFWWVFRGHWFWMVPGEVLLVMGLVALSLFVTGDSTAGGGVVFLTVAGALATIGFWVGHGYWHDQIYARSITVTTTPVPGLAQRVPFEVSQTQVRSNLGDIPGDAQETTFLPDVGVFTTPVERRGTFEGYETLLSQQIGLGGRNTPSRCDFGLAADRRLGGWFAHSLGRLVNTTQRWVNWDDSDVYGYCENGTPMVVVPLKEQDGFFVVTERPVGVAVYNGVTGALEIRDNARGVPGPSYPLSVAAVQRESSGAVGGFWDWVWNRAGWELPDETENINSGNESEFVLATAATGDPVYATLLTGRGSATAVSAISVIDAQLSKPGLGPLVVHRTSPVWLSPGSFLDRVRADFGDVFAVQRDAKVFELAPLGSDRWVATIGTSQNLLYRVTGEGALREAPCLWSLEGNQIRCGAAVNVGAAGPGIAVGGSVSSGPVGAAVPAVSDLDGLTVEQLVDLQNRVGRELGERATAPAVGR